jgi:hypothetical protein
MVKRFAKAVSGNSLGVRELLENQTSHFTRFLGHVRDLLGKLVEIKASACIIVE